MIEIIAYTALLYLVQLLLPIFLKTGSEQAERAAKAVNNLGESLPVFFTLAILSVVLKVEENTSIALYWLVTRLLFVVIYISGVGRQERLKDESSYEPQIIRSLIWFVSVSFLIWMTVNLIFIT